MEWLCPYYYFSKYPGLLGNSLKVSICDSNTTLLATWAYADETGPVTWEVAKAHVEEVLAQHSKQ